MREMSAGEAVSLAEELAGAAFGACEQHLAAGDEDAARNDLDELARALAEILSVTGPGGEGYPQVALYAAWAQQELWDCTGDPACLLAVIQYARSGLRWCRDPAVAVELRLTLAVALADMPGPGEGVPPPAAPRAGKDEAIEILTGVQAELSPGDDRLPGVASVLGRLRYGRWAGQPPGTAGPDPADLDAAITLLTAAARAWSPASGDAPGVPADQDGTDSGDAYPATLWYLVLALSDRLSEGAGAERGGGENRAGAGAERGGGEKNSTRDDAADTAALIAWGERFTALPASDADTGETALVHEILADALLSRAEDRPATWRADLDASIGHYKALLAAGPGDEERAGICAQIAHAQWLRLDGDATDYGAVDEMTGYARQAWQLLPADDPVRVDIGLYLAIGLQERQVRPGEPFHLASANLVIDVLTRIEPELADAHDLHLMAMVILGLFLVSRGQVTGSMADLVAAQPWLLRAAGEIPVHDPQWGDIVQSLAASMLGLAGTGIGGQQLDQTVDLLAVVAGRETADLRLTVLRHAGYGMALIQRAGFTASAGDLDLGIKQLRQAYELTADQDPNRLLIAWNLGSALLTRFSQRGNREDLDAAEFYCETMTASDDLTRDAVRQEAADADIVIAAMRGAVKAARGAAGDAAALDEAVTHFRAALALTPPGHPYRDRIRSDLGLALTIRAGHRGAMAGDLQETMAELDAAAAALPDGHVMKPFAQLRRAAIRTLAGRASGDAAPLREAAGILRATLATLGPEFGERARLTASLGQVYNVLHGITGSRADLEASAHWLATARDDFDQARGHPLLAEHLMQLARVYRQLGDAAQARDTGLAGLRERGRDVLLQTGTTHALGAASAAAAEAAAVASWCLDGGQPDRAIEALELGRGLVLHAATSVAQIPELLDDCGRADLAREWRETITGAVPAAPWETGPGGAGQAVGLIAGDTPLELPNDLRSQALAALAGTGTARLLAPPAPAQIAAALAGTGADALVYLLGPQGKDAGRAVVIRAGGPAGQVPEVVRLPLLHESTDSALRDYAAALTAQTGPPPQGATTRAPAAAARDEPAVQRWRDALQELCEWAWPAVMRPLLAHVQRWQLGRAPRLVLVPAGRLSLVPWHAATWHPAEAGPRYACQEAVVSYAASGRQLIEVSGRPQLPLRGSPVVLGNPTLDLLFAALEAQAIHDVCYPEGDYFGFAGPLWAGRVAGPGSRQEVLGQLPSATAAGASVIHLGCHAMVAGGAPGKSCLRLAHHEELRVEDILRRAHGRAATAPGGLVSLAACQSDLAADEYDEALTLSTAFLAAGAVTVVGARWEIPDGVSSLQMFMFHRFMTAGGHPPRDALRLAQLWMLDPGRQPPPEMPPPLARLTADPGLSDVSVWAAITHQGR